MKSSAPQPSVPASPPPSAVASSRHRVTGFGKSSRGQGSGGVSTGQGDHCRGSVPGPLSPGLAHTLPAVSTGLCPAGQGPGASFPGQGASLSPAVTSPVAQVGALGPSHQGRGRGGSRPGLGSGAASVLTSCGPTSPSSECEDVATHGQRRRRDQCQTVPGRQRVHHQPPRPSPGCGGCPRGGTRACGAPRS